MKNLILLIAGFLKIISISGQNYFPLIQENNEWNTLQVIYPGTGNPWDTLYWTLNYKLEGDTMINNTSYKKVLYSEEEIPTNFEFYGGLREDENHKVWFYPTIGLIEERLIYNFSANVGDTIENYASVMIVDSISYHEIAGAERKHIYLSYDGSISCTELWVEGIGSNYGILSSGRGCTFGGWTWFLCKSENGELVYMNPNYNSCHLISTNIEEMNNSIIEVYPNPAHYKINIKNTENIKIESISIFDLEGQKLLDFNKNKTEIELSGISTGIYLLKVNYENGELIKKILVE